MFILLLKIVMLSATLKFHLMKEQPFHSALLYSLPISIIGLILGNTLFAFLLGGALTFAFAYAYFWLLSTVSYGTPYYSVAAIGAITLVVFF